MARPIGPVRVVGNRTPGYAPQTNSTRPAGYNPARTGPGYVVPQTNNDRPPQARPGYVPPQTNNNRPSSGNQPQLNNNRPSGYNPSQTRPGYVPPQTNNNRPSGNNPAPAQHSTVSRDQRHSAPATTQHGAQKAEKKEDKKHEK
jgi:hypothetical protein